MSVRKRTWLSHGLQKEAWVVDYSDQHGARHLKTFRLRSDADRFNATFARVAQIRDERKFDLEIKNAAKFINKTEDTFEARIEIRMSAIQKLLKQILWQLRAINRK